MDIKNKGQTLFVKSLTEDVKSLISAAKSEDAKAECKKVYEAVRYSDPMSSDVLGSVESQITIAFIKLSEAVTAEQNEAVKEFASELIILSGDRNNKCKLLKNRKLLRCIVAELVCDSCGGKLIMGAGDIATCENCGIEHSVDRMKEKIQ